MRFGEKFSDNKTEKKIISGIDGPIEVDNDAEKKLNARGKKTISGIDGPMEVDTDKTENSNEETEEVEFGKGEKKEILKCRRIEFNKEFPPSFFEDAEQYKKIGLISARMAGKGGERIISSKDANKWNDALEGDWIIQNLALEEDPYVFGDKYQKDENGNDELDKPISVEDRQKAFAKKYELKKGETDIFVPKGIIRAKKVTENLVWQTSWGSQDGVKAGGWVAEGGYAIAEDSFDATYEKIENDKK